MKYNEGKNKYRIIPIEKRVHTNYKYVHSSDTIEKCVDGLVKKRTKYNHSIFENPVFEITK